MQKRPSVFCRDEFVDEGKPPGRSVAEGRAEGLGGSEREGRRQREQKGRQKGWISVASVLGLGKVRKTARGRQLTWDVTPGGLQRAQEQGRRRAETTFRDDGRAPKVRWQRTTVGTYLEVADDSERASEKLARRPVTGLSSSISGDDD